MSDAAAAPGTYSVRPTGCLGSQVDGHLAQLIARTGELGETPPSPRILGSRPSLPARLGLLAVPSLPGSARAWDRPCLAVGCQMSLM